MQLDSQKKNSKKPESSTVATGKQQKVAHSGDDDEIVMMDESYFARRPSLEDQFKQIAEAAKGADDNTRRTRRNVTAMTASNAQANTPKPDSAVSHSTAENVRKHNAYTAADAKLQSILDSQEPTSGIGVLKNSNGPNISPEESTKPPKGRFDRSLYPEGPMTRDPKIRLRFLLGLLEHEENGKKKTQLPLEDESAWQKSKASWPEYHKAGKIYFGADGETIYRPDSESKGSPARSSRGGGRGGRGRGGPKGNGGRGGGNGNGGRGRPKGKRNGEDDDPEPPRKTQVTEEEDEQVKRLKQRQQELKKLFSTVGAPQAELLDQLAGKDLNKLIKKPRAHTKVPEYDELRDNL